MKSPIVFLFAFICTLFLFNSSFGLATPGIPCAGNCDSTTWSEPRFISFNSDIDNCPECWIGFWFTERVCNDEPEFQMLEVVWSEECSSCYSVQEIFRMAFEQSLFYLTNGGLPEVDTCTNMVRFITAPCWQQVNVIGNTVWGPCNTSTCCETKYKICHPSPLVVTWEVISGPTSGVCPDSLCWYICGWFNYSDSANKKVNPPPDNKIQGQINDNLLNSSKCTIFPNPVNNCFTIYVEDEKNLDINVEINNIYGSQIFQDIISGNGKSSRITVQTENWVSGVYFCKVKSGKQLIFNKTILIIKN